VFICVNLWQKTNGISEVKSQNKLIVLIALVCAAPFVSAWIAYYFYTPTGGKSYGQLLETKPVPKLALDAKQIEAIKGKWLLIQRDDECEKTCSEALYATRQARTILNKEKDRLVRVLLTQKPLSDELARAHPDLLVSTSVPPDADIAALLLTKNVLLDPQNNQVIAWDRSQDVQGIKRLTGDLSRLMRATKWSTQ
jgi:hypothetical protein